MTLTRADRCDARDCPAAAQARWIKPGQEGDLLFCGHHDNKNAGPLAEKGWVRR